MTALPAPPATAVPPAAAVPLATTEAGAPAHHPPGTEPATTAPVVAVRRADRRKSILVVDEDTRRGELRASRLRLAGVEVRYASSVEEAAFFLQEADYDLVLVEMRKNPDSARGFCSSVRRRSPGQRMAFYVDGPQCISWSEPDPKPNSDRAVGLARLNALLGTPAAPRPGSVLDASRRIRLNRQLAALRSRPATPNK